MVVKVFVRLFFILLSAVPMFAQGTGKTIIDNLVDSGNVLFLI